MFSRALTILLLSAASIAVSAQLPRGFLRGGDVSEIPEVEATGGHYSYQGKTEDPFRILKKAGWNWVRFRIWNHPKDGFCDKEHTLAAAKRAKAAGLAISLDFHYSDWWADPGKQYAPAAWKELPMDKLTEAVYDYTKDVVDAMNRQGTRPNMVQIGNEITAGMIWPQGKLASNDPAQWKNLAALIDAGIRAVHDADGNRHRILTMIHLDRGGDNKGARWWFDHLKAEGVDFDTIGLSFYPFWHGTLTDLQANVNDLAVRYGKDIYVVETAYPWTIDRARGQGFAMTEKLDPEYPPTPEGQAKFLRKMLEIVQAIPGGRGKGLLYWAPTWISTKTHIPWSNMATFNDQGEALPGVRALGGKKD
ncbi:glycoside hydrolase family 53 protein [Fimbriimonas ginsengisoli]|uniref:Arabinogalactan endo-beta-1,4-galactanase n=1 Tax=Fimbriimonas ginsengisoli Gsoil 348 TaxID=661478 RepID=A0A068NRP7_FIMGI|nr:glycosyl hydrolase 53 family protein [Fimbriimonas ginsengisoli]AIE86081.1 arabinogalactan endo-1,4-beta-galactosidase [Fimbriimonas ginsengisoli Gsoil 348]